MLRCLGGRLMGETLVAFDASVAAADWIGSEHGALVSVGRRLATAIDGVDDEEPGAYSQLSRLSLELRNVCRQLGLTVDRVPAAEAVVEVSPLKAIRESG